MRPYSRSLRLCSRTTSGVTGALAREGERLGGAGGGGAGHRWSQLRTRLRLPKASEITRVSSAGPLLVRHGVDLAGVEPHAAAVGAGLDLHAVVGAAGQVVAVLGALHVVRLALGFARRRLRPAARCLPEQLGVLLDEVLVLVAAGLVGRSSAGHVERGGARPPGRERREEPEPVGRAEQRVGDALGMRHDADHGAGGVARCRRCGWRSRSGSAGAARPRWPARSAAPPGPPPRASRSVSSAATNRPSPWATGSRSRSPVGVGGGEHGLGALHDDVHRLRDEREPGVPHQRAGQQVGLAQDLEAVADAEHRAAVGRVALHRLHDRAEPGDGAGAEVVAVAEAAGQDHDVRALKAGVAVPDEDTRWRRPARRRAAVSKSQLLPGNRTTATLSIRRPPPRAGSPR